MQGCIGGTIIDDKNRNPREHGVNFFDHCADGSFLIECRNQDHQLLAGGHSAATCRTVIEWRWRRSRNSRVEILAEERTLRLSFSNRGKRMNAEACARRTTKGSHAGCEASLNSAALPLPSTIDARCQK